MREHKFRAWDAKEQKMYYEGFYVTPQGEVLWRNVLEADQGHYVLEEWTGKRDSKRTKEYPEGQDIYEGDRFRVSKPQGVCNAGTGGKQVSIGVVEFNARELQFQCDRTFCVDGIGGHLLHLFLAVSTVEVIGTIHDAPEDKP